MSTKLAKVNDVIEQHGRDLRLAKDFWKKVAQNGIIGGSMESKQEEAGMGDTHPFGTSPLRSRHDYGTSLEGQGLKLPSEQICTGSERNIASELINIAKELMPVWASEKYINWGWLNEIKESEWKRFHNQEKQHDLDKKRYPAEHKVLENVKTMRGYTHFKCSCGFEYQVDSGD